jgi:superfamily I DNA/RNA helicase
MDGTSLADVVPEAFKNQILAEVKNYIEPEAAEVQGQVFDKARPRIKLTSFEGSKGLSAQHVFIVGLHNGELPRNPAQIEDLEICKFIVALTRTRKQCHVMWTTRFSGQPKQPSIFLNWLDATTTEVVVVNKEYWLSKEEQD